MTETYDAAALARLKAQLQGELALASEFAADEAAIYRQQQVISDLNEQRHVLSLEVRNMDRKINFVVQNRIAKEQGGDEEGKFDFFDQSKRQDNPLGKNKSAYSSFLYLLRVEPVVLGKILMQLPFNEMDYMVSCLNFSLFPDLYQAREELYLLDLIKAIIVHSNEAAAEATDVMRQNSMITKLVAGYTKRHYGRVHLQSALKPVLSAFLREATDELAFEVRPELIYKLIAGDEYDPRKSAEEVEQMPEVIAVMEKNKDKLNEWVQRFLEAIRAELPSMPFGIRYISKQLVVLAGKRFELNDKQRFQLVSSFIFLRYFLPAVLVPDAHGVADRDLSKTQRRPLILLGKIIQTFSTDTAFSRKEAFMVVFNEQRDRFTDMMRDYCNALIDVPEPHEYYATVGNLTRGRDQPSIFQNTTITMTPNELYTIHRMVARFKEEVPKHHPLLFFLSKLGDPPENVPRADDKLFSILLSAGDDDDDDARKGHLIFDAAEAAARALAVAVIPEGALVATNDEALALFNGALAVADSAGADLITKAIAAYNKVKSDGFQILPEIDRYAQQRQSYRASLIKEKAEMDKSIVKLTDEVRLLQEQQQLYHEYFTNIVSSAFQARVRSKKEWAEANHIGPLDFSFSQLEKAGVIAGLPTKKSSTFTMTATGPGEVEMVISGPPPRTMRLSLGHLLDMLSSQDTVSAESLSFDVRNLATFLAKEVFC